MYIRPHKRRSVGNYGRMARRFLTVGPKQRAARIFFSLSRPSFTIQLNDVLRYRYPQTCGVAGAYIKGIQCKHRFHYYWWLGWGRRGKEANHSNSPILVFFFIFSGPTHHAQEYESDAEKPLQLHSQPTPFSSQRKAEEFYGRVKVARRNYMTKNMKPHNLIIYIWYRYVSTLPNLLLPLEPYS